MCESANKLYMSNHTELNKTQIYESISHTNARACGLCDAIRLLGYEVRDEDGMIATNKYMHKLFALNCYC